MVHSFGSSWTAPQGGKLVGNKLKAGWFSGRRGRGAGVDARRRACSERARGHTIVLLRIVTKFDDRNHPPSTRAGTSRSEGRRGVGASHCVHSAWLCNWKKLIIYKLKQTRESPPTVTMTGPRRLMHIRGRPPLPAGLQWCVRLSSPRNHVRTGLALRYQNSIEVPLVWLYSQLSDDQLTILDKNHVLFTVYWEILSWRQSTKLNRQCCGW